MTRLYTILRIVAYIAGLIGMALFVTARQSAEPQSLRAAVGGTLLMVSFGCFLGAYVVYLAIRLRGRRN
jgi:hypothetical protein